MKKIAFALSALALATSGVALAQTPSSADGTVEIRGKVVDQTCEVATDYKNLVVVLDTIGKNKLDAKAKTAGTKSFAIKVTGCKVPATDGAKTVFASFSPISLDHIDEANAGTLKNRAETQDPINAAKNVNIQLVNGLTNKAINLAPANGTTPGGTHPLDAQGNKWAYEAGDDFVTTGKKINENKHATTILGKKVVGGESVFGQIAIDDNEGTEITAPDLTLNYAAQYYATDVAEPGLVEAFVTYNIAYK